MATNLIPLATDARQYGELANAIRQLRSSVDSVNYVYQNMLEMRDTSVTPIDYSQIASYYGCSVADAQKLFILVKATYDAMNTPALLNLISRVV